MSIPTEEQVRQLLLRVQAQLDEWDDVSYSLCVMLEGRNMASLCKLTPEEGVRVSRNTLNQVLDQYSGDSP